MKSEIWSLDRLDEWTSLSVGPSATPDTFKVHGYVCRGMNDEGTAHRYAQEVADFFSRNGLEKTVFVVAGPTSTNRRSKFEVTDACSTYPVVHRLTTRAAQPGQRPQPGMALRTAIMVHGLEALRGIPLDTGLGQPEYISNRCLDGDIRTWADEPTHAFRIMRFYGGERPDAEMVRWIIVGTTRIAAPAPLDVELPVDAQPAREPVRERG